MRVALLLVATLLLAGCAGLAPPRSDAKVDALSWALVDGRLVGELVNHGPSNAAKVRVVATFFAANGSQLGRASAPAWRLLLEAGESSAFDLDAPAGAVNATVLAEAEATRDVGFERQHLAPRDVRTTQRIGATNVSVDGFVVNQGELPIASLQAHVVFRDADGKVVGAARVAPEAAVLRAGESTPFHADVALAGEFLRYDVVVVTTSR